MVYILQIVNSPVIGDCKRSIRRKCARGMEGRLVKCGFWVGQWSCLMFQLIRRIEEDICVYLCRVTSRPKSTFYILIKRPVKLSITITTTEQYSVLSQLSDCINNNTIVRVVMNVNNLWWMKINVTVVVWYYNYHKTEVKK